MYKSLRFSVWCDGCQNLVDYRGAISGPAFLRRTSSATIVSVFQMRPVCSVWRAHARLPKRVVNATRFDFAKPVIMNFVRLSSNGDCVTQPLYLGRHLLAGYTASLPLQEPRLSLFSQSLVGHCLEMLAQPPALRRSRTLTKPGAPTRSPRIVER